MKKFKNKSEMSAAFPFLAEGERFEVMGEIFEKRRGMIVKPGYKDPGKISPPERGRFNRTAKGYCPKKEEEGENNGRI